MQAEMNRLFAEGGVLQEGGTVDPVSGNEVPPGAMAEEVRDDIDAKLSEGEFVFPADVVRYWGLEKLMMMRDKAKMGLKKMAEIGQMGNANEVPDGEALHGGEEEMDDEEFSSEIDSIMSEEGGGEDREYDKGGYVVPENEKLYRDAPIKGFEMVAMVNDAGQTIYIPFINGVAQLSIPTGYKVKTTGATETSTTTTPAKSGGGTGGTGGDVGVGGEGGPSDGGGTTSGPGFTIGDDGKAVANETSTTLGSIVGGILGFATLGPAGINIGSKAGAALVGQLNFANAQAAMSFNVATKDTTDPANLTDVTSQAATMGKSGTGGAAAAAGAAAASAAANAGHGPAAQGAAAQAAADAIVGGASPSAAAQAGADAAASASGGTTGPGSATGFGVGSSIGINSMDAQSDAASAAAAGYAAADAVGAEGLGVGNIGGGTTSGGNTGGLGFGTTGTDTGTDGTGAGTGGGGGGGGGVGAGNDGGGIGAGEGLAKGGLVSKPKKSNSKGLAGRRK